MTINYSGKNLYKYKQLQKITIESTYNKIKTDFGGINVINKLENSPRK